MRCGALSIVLAMTMFAAAQTAPTPAFEVASVKRQLPPIRRITFEVEGGRFLTEGFPTKYLLMRAFGVTRIDILGTPEWLDSDCYRIEAKVDGVIPPDEFPRMLQSLLEDRFHLKIHRETRELSVYELLVAKGGPKLKVSEDQTPVDPPPFTGQPVSETPRGRFGFGSGTVGSRAVPLSNLTEFLRLRLSRHVIDRTGLTGLFDITMRWDPKSEEAGPNIDAIPGAPLSAETPGPSLFTALQEQLGLRLQAAKEPVEVLVIDNISKPTDN